MNAIDEEMHDLTVALSAYLRGDLEGMAAVIARHPDRTGLLSKSLALNMYFLRKQGDPEGLLKQIRSGDPLELALKQESDTARARRFLLEQLADGPVRASVLRARALGERITHQTLINAAKQLGVQRGQRGDKAAQWSLPSEKSATRPGSR